MAEEIARKEISKEVYAALMTLNQFCWDNECDTCPFGFMHDMECMPYWCNPNGYHKHITEENGKYYAVDYED